MKITKLRHFQVVVPKTMFMRPVDMAEIMRQVAGYKRCMQEENVEYTHNGGKPIWLEFKRGNTNVCIGETKDDTFVVKDRNGDKILSSCSKYLEGEFIQHTIHGKEYELIADMLWSGDILDNALYQSWSRACLERNEDTQIQLVLEVDRLLRQQTKPGDAVLLPVRDTKLGKQALEQLMQVAQDSEVEIVTFNVRKSRTPF